MAILLLMVVFITKFDVKNCLDTVAIRQSSMVALTDPPSPPVHLDHSNHLLR